MYQCEGLPGCVFELMREELGSGADRVGAAEVGGEIGVGLQFEGVLGGVWVGAPEGGGFESVAV